MSTLVWLTNSFRLNSRLMASLDGECAFVYFSPYYFAGGRERAIYQDCTDENINAFHSSINSFAAALEAHCGAKLHIFRVQDPVATIRDSLIHKCGITKLVIDRPLFAFWHSIDRDALVDLPLEVEVVDSALIDPDCPGMTAKSRWMKHVKDTDSYCPFAPSSTIKPLHFTLFNVAYPTPVKVPDAIDVQKVIEHAMSIVPTYGETRDRHDGQTRLSTALHNGVIDPHEVFFEIAKYFKSRGVPLDVNEGPAASILRQLAFRDIAIIRARRANLTLESTDLEIAKALLPAASYDNLIVQTPGGSLTFEKIKSGKTGVREIDVILRDFLKTGIMPNRARMLFASLVFYNSPTGVDALGMLLKTFDLLGLDGQSPNNMIGVCGSLELSYGKILKMNIDTAFKKLYG